MARLRVAAKQAPERLAAPPKPRSGGSETLRRPLLPLPALLCAGARLFMARSP
jgi:hypothetical protein